MQNCLTSNDSFNDLVINFFSEHSLNIMVMTERVNKKLFSNFFSFFCQTLYISWQIWTKQIFFFYRMSEILCGRIFGWCPMRGCFERSMCNYSIKKPKICVCVFSTEPPNCHSVLGIFFITVEVSVSVWGSLRYSDRIHRIPGQREQVQEGCF